MPERGTLLLRAGVGWRPGLVGRHETACDPESAAGRAWHARVPVLSNAGPGRTPFRVPAIMRDHGIRRAINVPVPAAEGGPGAPPFGVLEADSRDGDAFSPDDVAFPEALANALSVALGREAARRGRERLLAEAAEARRLRESARAVAAGEGRGGVAAPACRWFAWTAAADPEEGDGARVYAAGRDTTAEREAALARRQGQSHGMRV